MGDRTRASFRETRPSLINVRVRPVSAFEASGHPQLGIPAARLVKFGVQMEVQNLTK